MKIFPETWNEQMEIGLHLIIWLFVLLVHAWVFNQFMPYEVSLLRAVVNVLPMAAIFYLDLWLVNRFLERRQYLFFVFLVFLIFAAATIFRAEINTLFPDIRSEIMIINERRSWFFGAIITNLSVLVIGTFYQMLYNRYQTEKRNLAIINEQREAQLQALRAQINPHFLFNTLNNIYSLAVVKSDKTAEMVLKLSSLLRYVIYEGRARLVSLKREAAQIDEFINLFRMRSEENLDISYLKEGIREEHTLEPMILIPLVENCFKHCDFDTNESAYVKLDLEVKNNTLYFTTINTRNATDRQKDQVGGVGLDNIKKRLELKYAGQYALNVKEEEDRFFVHLKLQLSHGQD